MVAGKRMSLKVRCVAYLLFHLLLAANFFGFVCSTIQASTLEHKKEYGDYNREFDRTGAVQARNHSCRDKLLKQAHTGFLMPGKLHVIHLKGPGLLLCRSLCRIFLTLSNISQTSFEKNYIHERPLKKIVLFSDLESGEYLLETSCRDAETKLTCFTEPRTLRFKVAGKSHKHSMDFYGNHEHIRVFTKPRNTSIEQKSHPTLDLTLQQILYFGVICVIVACGLVLISYLTY